jgi:chaperonin GroEL (HSP60 family)
MHVVTVSVVLIFGEYFMGCNREADITKERIEKVLKAGANVILTTKGIDDMALKVRASTLLTMDPRVHLNSGLLFSIG